MNKTIMFLGMLAMSFANAQQTNNYDGKVGINTETPTATLNVKSKEGKDATTKNFELENAANKKLVTVLDNGHFGILAEPLEDVFNIQNLLRFNYWGRSLGLGISATPHSQWARGYNFSTSDGATNFGGFGGFGLANSLKYFYIGKDYTNTIAKFDTDTGNVGIGINTFTSLPTNKLHIKSEADPLRLEGLQNAKGNGNKSLVVDANGVVKVGTDASTSDNNLNLWQKQANGDIVLVDNNITSNIAYTPDGLYKNTPKTTRQVTDFDSSFNMVTKDYDISNSLAINSGILNVIYADKIKESFTNAPYKEKYLNFNHLVVDDQSNGTNVVDRFFVQKNHLLVNKESTRNFASLYGGVNTSEFFGTGRVNLLMGAYNYASANNGTTSHIVGTYNQASSRASTQVYAMDGIYNHITPRGTGKITSVYGARNLVQLRDSSNNIDLAVGIYNQLDVQNSPNSTINKLIGASVFSTISPEIYKGVNEMYGMKIDAITAGQSSNYGLYIGDVGNSTSANNYSIYTGTGKVHLGDEVEVKSTIKVADNTVDKTCTTEKAGTIRFDATAKKFQGCTGDNWVDLHN